MSTVPNPSAVLRSKSPKDAAVVVGRSEARLQKAALAMLTVFTAVTLLLTLLTPEVPWTIRLLVIAIVLLTLRHWGGTLVLILVQADLFLREGKQFRVLAGFGGIILAAFVLAVLMLIFRQRSRLKEIANTPALGLAREMLKSFSSRRTADELFSAGIIRQLISTAVRCAIQLSCCVTLAAIAIALLPAGQDLRIRLRQAAGADPTLSAGALLLVLVIATWLIASEISWRQLTPAQARVYLRSQSLRIHFRDLRMIVRRRLTMRRKLITAAAKKKREKSGDDSPQHNATSDKTDTSDVSEA